MLCRKTLDPTLLLQMQKFATLAREIVLFGFRGSVRSHYKNCSSQISDARIHFMDSIEAVLNIMLKTPLLREASACFLISQAVNGRSFGFLKVSWLYKLANIRDPSSE